MSAGLLDDLDLEAEVAGSETLTDDAAAPVAVQAPLNPMFAPAVDNPSVSVDLVDDQEADDNRGETLLYFDLETIPDFDRAETFGFDPVAEWKETPTEELLTAEEFCSQDLPACREYLTKKFPPESWVEDAKLYESKTKKPRKGIDEALDAFEAKRKKAAEEPAQRMKLLSTTPEYCRVLSLAWAVGNQPIDTAIANDSVSEEQIIRHFWHLADGRSLVCYNGIGFDLPVLLVRSAMLGIRPPRLFSLSRFANRDVLDLMLVRFGNIAPSGMSLKRMAKLYGIPIPAGDVDGSQVLELYQAGQFDRIKEYNASDVELVRGLHKKFRGRLCG